MGEDEQPMIDRESRSYPWVLLLVLSLTYLCATLDRIVISLLVDPIKADLGLTDTEVSLLLGLAFVLVFSITSLVMGVLVDRMRRNSLLAGGIAGWSVMTALCGLSSSFPMLFLARAGVGVGEATLTPAGYSLIADTFDKRRLGLALGIFTMGGAVGTGLSMILGGAAIGALSQSDVYHLPVLGALKPWQLIFVLLSIPGFFITIIVWLMPEPERRTVVGQGTDSAEGIGDFYRQNSAFLSRQHIAVGTSSMVLLGAYSWIAPLLSRVHGWHPADVGYAVGVVSLIGAPLGLVGGGFLGDRLLSSGAHHRLWICAISVAIGAVAGALYPILPDANHAIIAFGIMITFVTVPVGVGNAALQHVVPGSIRGRVSAVYFFCVSLIGMLGPTLIAGTSDIFFPLPNGIATATAIIIPLSLIIATLLWMWAIPPYRRLLAVSVGTSACAEADDPSRSALVR